MMQAQKAQQKSGKPPKGGAAKVIQPHIHGSGFYRSSVHRKDKYEYQAEEAARRILYGEEGVANKLISVAASSYKVSTSIGKPLSLELREDLEKSFGADLSAVRIHHDQAANIAAENESARAFTSGRDIYFASGVFSLSSDSGREVLIHEMTHVLQQTGRKSSDGRLRATDIRANGDIQREDLIEER